MPGETRLLPSGDDVSRASDSSFAPRAGHPSASGYASYGSAGIVSTTLRWFFSFIKSQEDAVEKIRKHEQKAGFYTCPHLRKSWPAAGSIRSSSLVKQKASPEPFAWEDIQQPKLVSVSLTMKTHTILSKVALFSSMGAALMAVNAQAQYNPARGNMEFALREVNGASRGTSDIVVDLGAYTRFTSGTQALLLGGSSASESYQGIGPVVASENRFANSSVVGTFTDLDNIFMSAFAVNSSASATANSSFLLTKARTDVNFQSTPWNRASSFSQGGTGNKMETVRNNAINSGVDLNNTSTVEDAGVSAAYGNAAVSPFTGYTAMEANTGTGFSSGQNFVRLDLYDLPFGTGAGTYLGFFEYQADGDLWYVPSNFVPVPEASTYGLVAGAGALLLVLRRRMGAQTA